MIGNNETSSEIIEIRSECTPKMNIETRKHIKLRNPKRTIIDDLEMTSELMLNQFEFGFEINEGTAPGAFRSRICISEEEQR
jgi:hypothetical protein